MAGSAEQYTDAITRLAASGENPLVSVILFGSAASGALSASSDVDLILVLTDDASREDRFRLRDAVLELELTHGLRSPATRRKNFLERYLEHAGGEAHSCFLCTRDDLISGEAARLFGLRPVEALLVDRIVYASVIVSAKTVWGEELLTFIPVPPLRRLDVFKALLGPVGLSLVSVVAYPVLDDATRYAMNALKHSLHNCYFCYHGKTAPLGDEVEFFDSRLGQNRTLSDLMERRRNYCRSFRFVARCLPVLFRLHLLTAFSNSFPRAVTRGDRPRSETHPPL
jgi:predicted nucleotidyltransferase